MSLIKVRKERREEGFGGPRRPPRLYKLLIGLALVILLFWYLGRYV